MTIMNEAIATIMTEPKRVSFSTTQKAYCNPHDLSVEELKSLTWYSETELKESREDARMALEALHEAGGNFDLIDDSKICLRGIEKYADVVAKVTRQRRLIQSILEQQATNRQNGSATTSGGEHLAVLSKFLSTPSIQLAQFYAAHNAQQAAHSSFHTTPTTPCDGPSCTDMKQAIVVVVESPASQLSGAKRRLEPQCSDEESNIHRRNVKMSRVQSSE
jgi:hypothetical protein